MKFLSTSSTLALSVAATLVQAYAPQQNFYSNDAHLTAYGAQYGKWPSSSNSYNRAPQVNYAQPIPSRPISSYSNNMPPGIPNPVPTPTTPTTPTTPNGVPINSGGSVTPTAVDITSTTFQPIQTNLNQLGSDFSTVGSSTTTSTTSLTAPASLVTGLPATATLRLQGNGASNSNAVSSLLTVTGAGILMTFVFC